MSKKNTPHNDTIDTFPIAKNKTSSALLAAFANPIGNANIPAAFVHYDDGAEENNK